MPSDGGYYMWLAHAKGTPHPRFKPESVGPFFHFAEMQNAEFQHLFPISSHENLITVMLVSNEYSNRKIVRVMMLIDEQDLVSKQGYY